MDLILTATIGGSMAEIGREGAQILDSLSTAGVSGGLGTILGGVFGFAGLWLKNRMLREQRSHEFEVQKFEAAERRGEREHQLQLMDVQRQVTREEHAGQLALARVEGSLQGLAASLSHDMTLTAPDDPLVNRVRSMTRPILTFGLWALLPINAIIGAGLSMAAGPVIAESFILYTVAPNAAAAMTATLWWFGERPARMFDEGRAILVGGAQPPDDLRPPPPPAHLRPHLEKQRAKERAREEEGA